MCLSIFLTFYFLKNSVAKVVYEKINGSDRRQENRVLGDKTGAAFLFKYANDY